MKDFIAGYFVPFFALLLLFTFTTAAWSQTGPLAVEAAQGIQTAQTNTAATQQQDCCDKKPAWSKPGSWFVYMVIVVIFAGSLLAMVLIRTALIGSTWSLSDALSEEAEVTAFETVNGAKKPMMDAAQKPLMITEMRASTSRVVALMGMIVLVLMFIGFGTFALYGFAITGTMPESIDKVVRFLVGGLTLFAPYVVNKFSTMFESLSPKK